MGYTECQVRDLKDIYFSFDGGDKLTILADLNVGKCFVRSAVHLHHGSYL